MTEIFGTLGPACAQVSILEKMFSEGMTGMRLNLSHSGLKESEQMLHNFWEAAHRAGVKPELLIDMQGPEIRIGDLPAPLRLLESEEIEFVCEGVYLVDFFAIPISAKILSALEIGDHVLLDDGRLELAITSAGKKVTASVLRGGLLQKRKSLKIIDKLVSGPVITDQDKENIRLAKNYGVTALMQPFVTKGEQLSEIKKELQKNQIEDIRIFAKIENREGVKNIKDIIPCADMVVIARGDLGNDMPLWKLPVAQKTISEVCRKEGKPFLVVTQLLASMVQNPYPTRAEVSDIFHAVMDGAAAVMVTNETAIGKYPVEVIRYLKKTEQEASAVKDKEKIRKGEMDRNRLKIRKGNKEDIPLIHHLIQCMALYEKRPQDMTGTQEQLNYWLFEKNIAAVLIAEYDGEVAGYALYYPVFGSFSAAGKVHLEDLFLKEEFRGYGLGRYFFAKIAEIVLAEGYTEMEWNCLDWNEPSLGFYKKLGAKEETGREYFGFDKAGLEAVAVAEGCVKTWGCF